MAKIFDINRRKREPVGCCICGEKAETMDEYSQPLCYECFTEQHPEYVGLTVDRL